MSYHRASSPGSRRLAHPARLSDGYYPPSTFAAYASPRSSGERVVPISTTTFVTRDAYSGRPRRSTLTDPSRPTTIPSSTNTALPVHPVHPRSRPAVIQSSHDRPHSPSSPHAYSTSTRTPDYYAVPAASHKDHSHKKVYSIDGGGKSRLVADIDINTTHGSSHRRNSVDRNSDRHATSHHRHKGYHLSGPSTRRSENDQGFSYTDPAAMYRETEPRWRHRAGSVEATRPRPTSALVEQYPPRSSARDLGPPTSRALDKFNDGAGRSNSTRELPRSSNRLSYQEPQYSDGYTSSSGRHHTAVHQDRSRDAYPREPERARPMHRYEDRSVERRGFGIRSGSQDRHNHNHNMNKGSSESFDAYYSDRDRDYLPPRSDPRPYDYPRESDRDREYRPRDKDRLRDEGYASERDRHHERDRRDHNRRDRDRDVTPRGSGDSLTNTILPAAATAVGAMAAAAYGSDAVAKGRDREYEERERDREREREREKDRSREQRERDQEYERKQREREREIRDREREKREYERERDRDVEREDEKERERTHDRETRTRERDRDRPRHSSSSDSGQDRHRSSRRHRTLGADRSPPQEKDARLGADDRQRVPEADHTHPTDERQRVPERERPAPADLAEVDPDEDYRRRIEQAQRDLQGSHDNADSDRERSINNNEPVASRTAPPAAAAAVDYSESRDHRVRIVEPPSDREDSQPIRGILKRPTQKFPEDPNPMREGVKPLKETTKEGIPSGARWTKIDRRLVNPQALEEAQERFEERLDCVIVLRVLTKDEIQKLADKTLEIREARSYDDEDRERHERRENRRRERERERRERDEYEDDDSEDEYAPRAPRMLEAPVDGQEPTADFVRDRERRREREQEAAYAPRAI
ncbi:hypothetical protein E4T48_06875 [Aureobasidium sp. EXF-10727]|nr:hypothetical protein E4T48_06875 [Aureobasidium sp. EXF-10727]